MRKFLSDWAIVLGAGLAVAGVVQFSHRVGLIAAGFAVIVVAVNERHA